MEATIPAVSAKESTKGFWGNKRAALHGQARFRHAWWIAQRRACGHWGSVQGRGRGEARRDKSCFRVKSRFRQSVSVPGLSRDRKIMPERRHICSRLTLTLFFSLSDTQTTTPVCHYGPIPDGPPPKGRIERIGPVVPSLWAKQNYYF